MGIDPGLRLTGFAVVQLSPGSLEPTLREAGVVRITQKRPLAERVHQLFDELSALMDETQPDAVAVEALYSHYQNPRTAILMAHARGVVLLAAQQRGTTLHDLPPNDVKKAVTGYGHASKEQVQRAVQAQFNLDQPPEPPDVADAIAIAACCARRLALDSFSNA